MGLFAQGRTVNQRTKEFARLAGISKVQAKKVITDMRDVQGTGMSEVMVIGAEVMDMVDRQPDIELEQLYRDIDYLVFNTNELTFSNGRPFHRGIVTPHEVRRIATATMRLFRPEYVELVRQRMAVAS